MGRWTVGLGSRIPGRRKRGVSRRRGGQGETGRGLLSSGHHPAAGSLLGSGKGGASLVLGGQGAAQQTSVTGVLGARSRGTEPGEMAGQNHGSHRPRTLAHKWRWAHAVAWEAGGQRGRQRGGQPVMSADLLATEEGQMQGSSPPTHTHQETNPYPPRPSAGAEPMILTSRTQNKTLAGDHAARSRLGRKLRPGAWTRGWWSGSRWELQP